MLFTINSIFWHEYNILTHWGRVMHICVSKLTIIGSDNGLSPGRHQAIIWTNGGILLIGPLGTNFSEILIEILIFSFKKMHLKMSSGKWRPSCLSLNVLIALWLVMAWCLSTRAPVATVQSLHPCSCSCKVCYCGLFMPYGDINLVQHRLR